MTDEPHAQRRGWLKSLETTRGTFRRRSDLIRRQIEVRIRWVCQSRFSIAGWTRNAHVGAVPQSIYRSAQAIVGAFLSDHISTDRSSSGAVACDITHLTGCLSRRMQAQPSAIPA